MSFAALGALHNLQTLRYYIGPNTTTHCLTEGVLQATPSNVKHILYSTVIPHDVTANLPNLEYFEYRNLMYFPEDGASDAPPTSPALHNIIVNLDLNTAIHTRLRSLAIDAIWVTRVPVWVYNQLVCLEINSDDPSQPINIDFICHHCSNLEEFSATGEIWAGFCLNLPQTPTLTKLRSLRLSCDGANAESLPDDEHFTALVFFIVAHNQLRRLYLRFPDAIWDDLLPLFKEVGKLQRLEVLGLHAGVKDLDEAMLAELLADLPLSPKALQLSMAWDTNTGSHVPIVMNKLSAMPNLKFLHIYGTYSRLPFSPTELAMDLKGLTRVGLTRALWDIDRSNDQVEALKWPRWKIKFFAESDFEDPDDAWLFKYH